MLAITKDAPTNAIWQQIRKTDYTTRETTATTTTTTTTGETTTMTRQNYTIYAIYELHQLLQLELRQLLVRVASSASGRLPRFFPRAPQNYFYCCGAVATEQGYAVFPFT